MSQFRQLGREAAGIVNQLSGFDQIEHAEGLTDALDNDALIKLWGAVERSLIARKIGPYAGTGGDKGDEQVQK